MGKIVVRSLSVFIKLMNVYKVSSHSACMAACQVGVVVFLLTHSVSAKQSKSI